jgi:hypothetical protein
LDFGIFAIAVGASRLTQFVVATRSARQRARPLAQASGIAAAPSFSTAAAPASYRLGNAKETRAEPDLWIIVNRLVTIVRRARGAAANLVNGRKSCRACRLADAIAASLTIVAPGTRAFTRNWSPPAQTPRP